MTEGWAIGKVLSLGYRGYLACHAESAGTFIVRNANKAFSESKDISRLLKAGQAYDRAGLTKVGRGLQKHGGRIGSFFPKPRGNPAQINKQGGKILESILNNPRRTTKTYNFAKYGDIVDIRVPPDHIGVRFYQSGKFIGFLEP